MHVCIPNWNDKISHLSTRLESPFNSSTRVGSLECLVCMDGERQVLELREAQDAAEHASMAKSIFLSTMSHEVC
jgi:tellurite resistance-related uncharacterized protein